MTRKRMREYYNIYISGDGKRSLEECYTKYSNLKLNALLECEKIQNKFTSTTAGRILTYNRMMFTYGFIILNPEIELFVVITKTGIHMREINKICTISK